MEENKNFIITSSDSSIHVMLPTSISPKDWATTMGNALVMAGQEFARLEIGCPCCVVDGVKDVLGGAMEHFRELDLLEDGVARANERTMESEDYHGLARAILTTVGLAIMSEGAMPKFYPGKDVMINIDEVRFPRYPGNHDQLEQDGSTVH